MDNNISVKPIYVTMTQCAVCAHAKVCKFKPEFLGRQPHAIAPVMIAEAINKELESINIPCQLYMERSK